MRLWQHDKCWDPESFHPLYGVLYLGFNSAGCQEVPVFPGEYSEILTWDIIASSLFPVASENGTESRTPDRGTGVLYIDKVAVTVDPLKDCNSDFSLIV